MENEIEFEEFEPSPVGNDYRRHASAMHSANLLSLNKSFQISGKFSLKLLRSLAEGFEDRKIIVIKHSDEIFEVSRLDDFSNVAEFYKFAEKGITESKREFSNLKEEQEFRLIKTIKEYFKISDEIGKIYDKNFAFYRESKIISYSYLHRKLASQGVFKKDRIGATNALKRTIKTLCERGDINELPKHMMHQQFGSNAVGYAVEEDFNLKDEENE